VKNAKQIVALVAGILAIIVIVQNTATVETHILWITISMPRAVLLALTFALGVLSGILFSMRRRT
jgi:uncharacterized integral membrane protein